MFPGTKETVCHFMWRETPGRGVLSYVNDSIVEWSLEHSTEQPDLDQERQEMNDVILTQVAAILGASRHR